MKNSSQAYLSLIFLTGLNLFNYLDRYVLSAVLTPLKAELNLTDSQLGWVAPAFMIGYFATAPVFGYLGDRTSRKWLIAFGVFFWSLGTILSGMSNSYHTLIASRILVGLGEASYATLAPAWLSDLFPSERRNNALTIFYVATPVGSALGFILGGIALGHGGWRTGFYWAGAPGLILAFLMLMLREPARGEADRLAAGTDASASVAPTHKPGWRETLSLFRIKDFNLILIGYTAYTFALGAFGYWGPTFLHRVHSMEVDRADHFFGIVLVVSGLVATLVGGFAATAWQRRNPAGYALLLVGSVALAIPFAAGAFISQSLTLSMICLGASIFLLFLPTGPVNTLIVENVPIALRASAMAASIFAIHLFGDFWSPVLIGHLADVWNVPGQPGAGLQRAVLILPVMMAFGTAFWAWLAWRKSHPLPPDVPATA
jgi:MFS family permease